jgi:hypothetical protein
VIPKIKIIENGELPMNVVFWGGESGSGTTSNMLVLDEILARSKRKCSTDAQHVFVDCGCRRDRKTIDVLMGADLVVINVKQSYRVVEDLFLELGTLLKKKHCFFLIGSYFKESACNRRCMEQIYRISRSRLGVIPYNTEFGYACECGKQKYFIRHECANLRQHSQQNRDFLRAVKRAAYDLQKYMDEIEGGSVYGDCI